MRSAGTQRLLKPRCLKNSLGLEIEVVIEDKLR
jgi:hypothetical protein